MKIYCAGPMRGYPLFNFPAFDEAQQTLEKMGHLVVSPAEMDRTLDNFNPETDKPKDMRYYMKRDLPVLMECEAVALLPGWKKSQGAMLEAHVAFKCGLTLYEYQPGVGLTNTVSFAGFGVQPTKPLPAMPLPANPFTAPKPTWPVPSIWCCGGTCVHLN